MSKGKRVAIYARVSQDSQTTENQELELQRIAEARGWVVVKVYIDHAISGAKFGKHRPALAQLRQDATRHRFEMVMAWAIDRIGRSTHEVSGFMEEMKHLGVDQFYLQQGIDSATPAGDAMIKMAAVFAEYERALIDQRIKAGVQRAREKGTKSGRPFGRPKIDVKIEAKIKGGLQRGTGILKLAKQHGVGTSVVQRIKSELDKAA